MSMLESCFEPYLLRSEVLRWTGRPISGIKLGASDIFLIPFSILWGGFALFWESAVVAVRVWPMALFGIPFVVIGLYITIGRFFVDAWMRRRIVYGITDRRALIFKSFPGGGLTAVELKNVSNISMSQRKNGEGSIDFGRLNFLWFGWAPWFPEIGPPRFRHIANVASVYRTIEDVRAGRPD